MTSNIVARLDAGLHPDWLRRLRTVSDVADRFDLRAYMVGGSVRDLILGLQIRDLDIMVVGATSEFADTVADALGGQVTVRSQFNTFAIDVDGERLDLTMARREVYEYPGALPSISPGSVADDLARRDFTINAMAVSINAASWGDMHDPFDGQADLRRRSVRVLHPLSFADDATRMFRAVRYASRLGFALEPETERLLRCHIPHLDAISGVRLFHELEHIFCEDKPSAALDLANRLGIMDAVLPNLMADTGSLTAVRRLDGALQENRSALILALLAYYAPERQHEALISRLSLDSYRASVVRSVRELKQRMTELSRTDLRRSQIHRMLSPYDHTAIDGCVIATTGTLVSERLRLFLTVLRHEKPILNGNDLMSMGVPQSPRIGELLNLLLNARLDGEIATRQDEVDFILAKIGCQ